MSFHALDKAGKLPSLEVAIDFTNDPTNGTRVWTDVTTDIRSISYMRGGRSDALQTTSTGSLSAVLDNTTGNYDPSNTAGAYYPGVKRMRWIRVRAQWAGVTYNRWQGLIESWVPSWPQAGKDSICTITAADALLVVSLTGIGGYDLPPQISSDRFLDVMSIVGLSRNTSQGNVTLVDSGTFSAGASALSHLQDVENTENGRMFADAGGTIQFQDRHWRLKFTTSTLSQGTIGDRAGEIPYTDDASLTSDDSNLWNNADITAADGGLQTASDATSVGHYFNRSYTRTLLTADPVDTLACAQYLVGLYKDPAPKLPVLTLKGARNTALWPNVLNAQNAFRYTFKRRPVYGGTIAMDAFVEQVSDSITPGESFDVRLQLIPAPSEAVWVLGDSVQSRLGSTTNLIF